MITSQLCVLRYKPKAMRTVRTHVKLVCETVKSDDMVKALRDTAACEWQGDAFVCGSESQGSNKALKSVLSFTVYALTPGKPSTQERLRQVDLDLLCASTALRHVEPLILKLHSSRTRR